MTGYGAGNKDFKRLPFLEYFTEAPLNRDLPPHLEMPDHPRRLKLHGFQWVGIPLMFLIPALALFSVFGESWDQTEDASPDLTLRVEYPTRYRYKEINTIQVFVENISGSALDTIIVAFDPAYVSRFSTLMFIPSPKEPFEIELLDVNPGEVRRVWAEFQGEHYGRHQGTIAAYRSGSTDTATVFVSTLIFP